MDGVSWLRSHTGAVAGLQYVAAAHGPCRSAAKGRAAVRRCNWACDRYSPRRFRASVRPPATSPNAAQQKGRLVLISPAFAQGTGGGDAGLLTSLLPFVLIFVIMYFLILRPQQKRAKQHQEMVKNVRRGDTVVTNGGVIGKVTKVIDEEQLEIELAEGVRVRQMRQMLADVRAKGEPVKEEG
jgi:preprotein translocase subunit YajC